MSTPEALTALETLTVEFDGPTAVVTINRPKALNALNQAVIRELRATFAELDNNAEVKGVILTGAGDKAFVAGADIKEITELVYEDAVSFSTRGQRLFATIENFGKPVVAAINGFALGGGCELAMACHIRVATESARFGQPEVNLGIIAGYGGTQRLPRLIGRTKGLELLLTGEHIKAEQALELGLVNYVVPADEVMNKAQDILSKCYTKAPLALQFTINAVNAGFEHDRNGYESEAVNFAKSLNTNDAKEGTAAFIDKRKPEFKGE